MAKPSLLTRLLLVAAVLLGLRVAAPAVGGHPVGRALLLVAVWLAVSFGIAFYIRRKRL
jgi:hypothetical protein